MRAWKTLDKKPGKTQVVEQSSNGRKIARMDRNLTIFGPAQSRRSELKLEKSSNERASKQANETNETNKFKNNFFFTKILFIIYW